MPELLADHPPSASEARQPLGAGDHRGGPGAAWARLTHARPCSCSAAVATSSSPIKAFPGRRRDRHPRDHPRRRRRPACGGVMVTVAAGETWDDLVATAVERGWVGVEALSGIPGSVGATPIQNVGAYGQEVSQTIASVRVWDRPPSRLPHLRRRRLRLRLPHLALQGRPRAARRGLGDLPVARG